MFYPFTATRAANESNSRRSLCEEEKKILLQANLSIAHVYIHRAAQMCRTKTAVYCPYEVRADFIVALSEAGFIVSPHPATNRYWVEWGES